MSSQNFQKILVEKNILYRLGAFLEKRQSTSQSDQHRIQHYLCSLEKVKGQVQKELMKVFQIQLNCGLS